MSAQGWSVATTLGINPIHR